MWYIRMPSISKNDCCADRSILALPSAYQECSVTFELMTSQVVQRARPLSGRIAKIPQTSPIVINMPTRELLAGETKSSFVQRFEHLKNKNKVCKQISSLYGHLGVKGLMKNSGFLWLSGDRRNQNAIFAIGLFYNL